jgi:hypothetical protein
MEPHEEIWALVEPVSENLLGHVDPEALLAEFQSSPEVARNLCAVWWLTNEVENGGFPQFFFNSSGVLGPEAVEAFRAIEMPKTADAVARAVGLFGNDYPRSASEREAKMESFDDDTLEALDEEFLELIESESSGWEAAASAYARRAGDGSRS